MDIEKYKTCNAEIIGKAWNIKNSKPRGVTKYFVWDHSGLGPYEICKDTGPRSLMGEPIPPSYCIPKKLFSLYSGRHSSRNTKSYLGDFFISVIGSGIFISSAFAEILNQYNLGANNHLTPIEIFCDDSKELIETGDTYYYLWLGETKDTLLELASAGAISKLSYKNYQSKEWHITNDALNNMVALDKTAMHGPDLWLESNMIKTSFFISDRLYTALKKEKFLRGLRCISARILDNGDF